MLGGWIITSHIVVYIVAWTTVTIRLKYDTIGEFNVDSKAEYSALSSTRSQKKN